VLLLLGQYYITITNGEITVLDHKRAIQFLEKQYNPDVGLCREATKVNTDLHWLKIDNYLAYWCLRFFDNPLCFQIYETLESYGQEWQGRVETILGGSLDTPMRYGKHFQVANIGNDKIMTERTSGQDEIPRWYTYADLVSYKILDLANKNCNFLAGLYLKWLERMWDGLGFYDVIAKEHNSIVNELTREHMEMGEMPRQYCSYKLALYLICINRLNRKHGKIANQCTLLLEELQHSDGGIITDYVRTNDEWINPIGDRNVETSCFTLLSIIEDIPLDKR